MKTLIDYIFESRYFKFTDGERAAVAEIVGFLTGAIGEAADIKKYSEYWGVLSNDGKEQMHDLYDVLSNEQDWPVINRNNIKGEIEFILILKVNLFKNAVFILRTLDKF